MKKLKLKNGQEVLLDDEDYERIPKTGWYLSDKYHGKLVRKTRYVVHDKLGRLHRYILNLTDPTLIVDHIDGNGLNNQKKNLRIVPTAINKRNQKTIRCNKFNFNGISLEHNTKQFRILVHWSENVENSNNQKRTTSKKKSFSIRKYNYNLNLVLKDAVLFRINKMKENDYLLDERSTTIERILLSEENPDMEKVLGISFDKIF